MIANTANNVDADGVWQTLLAIVAAAVLSIADTTDLTPTPTLGEFPVQIDLLCTPTHAIDTWINAKGTFDPQVATRILAEEGMTDFIAQQKNAEACTIGAMYLTRGGVEHPSRPQGFGRDPPQT